MNIVRRAQFIAVLLSALSGCLGSETTANAGGCDDQKDAAVSIAKELFAQRRPNSALSDYNIEVKVLAAEVLVGFSPKNLRLGDHPLVSFDCNTREGRFFEGE